MRRHERNRDRLDAIIVCMLSLESRASCGQACHSVMSPEFEALAGWPPCAGHLVSCHVGPGPGQFLKAKLSGSRQFALVAGGDYRQPIPVPVHDLPAVVCTCERCHWADRHIGDAVNVLYEDADDDANTPTRDHDAAARRRRGGRRRRGRSPACQPRQRGGVRRARRGPRTGPVRPGQRTGRQGAGVLPEGVAAASLEGKPRRRMDGTDRHNRPAHAFGTTAKRAVCHSIE
jgi:hypothetical protein